MALTLADAILGETLLFFGAYEKAERQELTLDEVQGQIDSLAVITQSLDVARSNPREWHEPLVAQTSAYEHLWPCEQLFLFLLVNYAALHAGLRKGLQPPLIAPESLAREVLSLRWLPHEVTREELVEAFLDHPATQVPGSP